MAFRNIERIQVSGFPVGTFLGGYIYNTSISVGYSDGPTTVTMNAKISSVDPRCADTNVE